jgi:hydroxymethylbilane synthase
VRRLVLGTRGSELARAQTALVEGALQRSCPELEVAIEIITTRGDEKADATAAAVDPNAGRKGLFTGEIERVLLSGQIDVAVHSAKDLPSETTPGLEVCAALPRATVEDVLVTKTAVSLADLPNESTVATGSVRRQHQLRWMRPDLNVPELRGNVPTRLRKLIANPWDGIILARAGLERLGFDCASGTISFEGKMLHTFILLGDQFIPAGGQGIVALQVRSNDEESRTILNRLNNDQTLRCLRAEREFLRLLQGDCGTPVGVLATIDHGKMTLCAQFFASGDSQPRAATLSKKAYLEPELIAAELLGLISGG